MAVPNRYVLQQGPVLATLARVAWHALVPSSADKSRTVSAPGPILSEKITPRPEDLVRSYVQHVGGDPNAYRGVVPAHLFPQWMFPLQARSLEGLPYPIHTVLNGGCRLEMNAPLSNKEPWQATAQLVDVDDNGRRVLIHQRLSTGTESHPDALVAHVYPIVKLPKKNSANGNGQAQEKPSKPEARTPTRVPQEAREIAFWQIGREAGLDFAKLTGDFNPIHWVPPYARVAGYRSTILHGFASLARTIEGINRALLAGDPTRLAWIDVKFTKPMLLPAKVGLYVRGDEVYVGDALGGPAYLVGQFAVRGEHE